MVFRWLALILLIYFGYKYINYLLRLSSKNRQTVPPHQQSKKQQYDGASQYTQKSQRSGSVTDGKGEYIDFEEVD